MCVYIHIYGDAGNYFKIIIIITIITRDMVHPGLVVI